MKPRKTWAEKLADTKDLPKVVPIAGRMSPRWGKGTVVVPAPIEVDALMRQVPKGRVTTVNELRAALAKRHGATIGCPITTGIFAWIAANASAEVEAAGGSSFTPWWRVLKSGGEVNPKFPGGVAAGCRRLEAEGQRVEQRGKRWFVIDYRGRLFTEFQP